MEDSKSTLTLGDMKTLLSMIDTVSARGAIHGDELSAVGFIRDKISLIIQKVEERLEKERQEKQNKETTDVN